MSTLRVHPIPPLAKAIQEPAQTVPCHLPSLSEIPFSEGSQNFQACLLQGDGGPFLVPPVSHNTPALVLLTLSPKTDKALQ